MKYLIIFLSLALQVPALAHGDLDARIKKVSKQIEKNPDDPALYKKRGILYFQHEEYKKSIADYEHALALGDDSEELSILRAKSYCRAKKGKIALDILQPILEKHPDDIVANRLTGQILASQNKNNRALKHLMIALEKGSQKLPEHYLEIADILSREKTHDKYLQTQDILQDGIATLGPLVVLLKALVKTHVLNDNFSAAINVQSEIIDVSRRKEIPYFERAVLYKNNNQTTEARKDLELAKEAIKKLPARHRRSSQTMKLNHEIIRIEKMLSK